MRAITLWSTVALLLTAPAISAGAELELPETAGSRGPAKERAAAVLHSSGTVALSAAGDRLFRLGDFAGAASAYNSATAADPDYARAVWGLSRVELVRSNRNAARDLASKAFRLDPRDPDVITHYAEFVSDPNIRAILFRNAAELTKTTDPGRARDLVARIAVRRRLAASFSPGDPGTRHTLKLDYFRPNGWEPAGLLLTARVHGGRPIRLVFDTGARDFMINPKVARELDLDTVSESVISGIGGDSARGRVAVARSVSLGDLELRDQIVEIADRKITDGADGIVGLNVFDGYRLRLDPLQRVLELRPANDPPTATDSRTREQVPLFRLGHLLFVKVQIDSGGESLFLLDTGAAFTELSPKLAASRRAVGSAAVTIRCGSRIDVTRLSPVRVSIGGTTFIDPGPVVVDLSQVIRQQRMQISGVLGFSTLRQMSIDLDLDKGTLQFDAPGQKQ